MYRIKKLYFRTDIYILSQNSCPLFKGMRKTVLDVNSPQVRWSIDVGVIVVFKRCTENVRFNKNISTSTESLIKTQELKSVLLLTAVK